MENLRQAKTGGPPTAQLDTLAPLIRQCLEEMSNTQTLLCSTRKELLIERERMKAAGSEVRQKRDEAGNAEVRFMNCVRNFVNSHLEQLPTHLLDAYEKVERTRDDLGVAEENYLQAERSLAGAEWTFMNREDRFYQFDINRILFETQSEGSTPPYSQSFEVTSHPPIHHLPPCPAGSLSPNQVSKLPPPPPPPVTMAFPPTRSSLESYAPMVPPSSASINGRHVAMLEGVGVLKKELSQLWQKESSESVWARGDEALFAEGSAILETDMTASRSEHSDILFDALSKEARAERLNTKDTGLALDAPVPALARRFSDSTYSSRVVSRLPVPMKRAQTESAALFNHCSPATTKKIEEWSLKHLKGSVIQKRLYLNTLQDNGLEGSIGSGLEDLATDFWSKDSLNHTRDSSELHAAFANGTEYETPSYRDQSVTQSIAPSLLMQHRLEGNLQPTEQMTADLGFLRLQKMMEESHEVTSQTVPLSPSSSLYDQTSGELGINDGNQMLDPAMGVLNDQRHLLNDSYSSDVVVNQPRCTCLAEFGDAAQRKDSVQSTHHPGCEMAAKHGTYIMTHRSSRERIDVDNIKKATMLDDRCDRTHQNQSVDQKVQHASKSDCVSNTRIQPDFNVTARSTSTLPATITKENVQCTESPITTNYGPIPRARRNTITWVRRLFPQFKYKRSKSSPSIGQYHSDSHV
ncbi:unnamed protein product [Alternaria alternata]